MIDASDVNKYPNEVLCDVMVCVVYLFLTSVVHYDVMDTRPCIREMLCIPSPD